MVDNLPLIPGKHAACTDVRAVLRTVFRELDYLPPLAAQTTATTATTARPPAPEHTDGAGDDGDRSLPGVGRWVDKYKSDCKKVSDHEDEIKMKHAKRVAREPLPNVFKLHQQRADRHVPQWRLDGGLLSRTDLTPAVEQNAGRDGSLWVKNILNVSSCNISTAKVGTVQAAPVVLNAPDAPSVQTFSVGGVVACRETPALSFASSCERADYILCVPPQLNFINCFVGQTYMKCIRLINVTKFECRLSITPPKRRELDVEINSPRGLTITSGATVELRIHFKPANVRVLTDRLVVRVSRGQTLAVPIECYMEPPLLGIAVPAAAPASAQASEVSSLGAECGRALGLDVLELGARLLGDVHCARVLLHCEAAHAAFFVLTEDAWLDWDLDCVTPRGAVVAESFAWWPACWRGGGAVLGGAWLRARAAGAHEAALRVLSCTATQRRVSLLGDSLHFSARHLVLEAHEKDFDIGGEADAACEYFVHAGTAHPHRALAASVRLVNCSPITYNYYWGARRWGACYCWDEARAAPSGHSSDDGDDSERLCTGARESKRLANADPAAFARRHEAAHRVEVTPARGEILPHAARALDVRVPDVGGALGVQRAVLRLILKDIPRESFLPGQEPVILSSAEVECAPVPGLPRSVHEVCEVVCAEMEVWWEVVPLRFTVHPPVVDMCHSRRLESIELQFSACKLFGAEATRAWWSAPALRLLDAPPALTLGVGQGAAARLALALPRLPNHYPETDVLTLASANDEWKVSCAVSRRCATRHPGLRPALRWLGVVLPRTRMAAAFALRNDTYQHICFWCTAYRWLGENPPRPACEGQIPCRSCRELACTCALLAPGRGALRHGEAADICYNVNAPERDGCVATLLQARRCSPDLSVVHGAAASEARAALVAYRVLAPRVTLRVRACAPVRAQCGAACALDAGSRGAATLRPGAALVAGRRTCYRLRVANVTPLATSVHFDEPIDGTDVLAVKFLPNDFRVAGHGEIDIRVVLSARRVSRRRVFVHRARVLHASRPVYLVVDTAIAGLEISLQVPMGGGVATDEFVIMRRTQTENSGDDESRPAAPEEMFMDEDRKRAIVRENICRCHFDLQYIPPVSRPAPPPPHGEHEPPELITEPPSLTRVCRCFPHTKPCMPDAPESISLQFINIPLRKVCSRRLLLRNESVLTAHWRSAVRRWPRRRARTLHADQWAGDVRWPGVALACCPPGGVLASSTDVEIFVQVYADCWGLYQDQILIKIRNVEPIVLDVWIEVVGPPLQFTIQTHYAPEDLPTMWFSSSDLTRSLIVKNVSRSELVVHAYITHENERVQDGLPFRLYMRLFDVLPATCPCVTAFDSDVGEQSSTSAASSATTSYSDVDMDTGVELFLAPDHGVQEDTYYDVQPEECTIKAGESMEWVVTLRPPPSPDAAPDTLVMLRLQPQNRAGGGWYRDEPSPQLARLRHAPREARVALSCDELAITICALDLPRGGFVRARKHFRVLNTGNAKIGVSLHTSLPWCVVQRVESRRRHPPRAPPPAPPGGELPSDTARGELVQLELAPRSSNEVCVEVCISTTEAWPCAPPPYAPQRRETTPLHLYDDFQVLTMLPLTVVVEYPIIKIEPALVDFGLVTDGDSRKTYVSVSHTSATKTLSLAASVAGCQEYRLRPAALHVAPGGCERVYIQYTSVWRHGPAEASITVHECGGAAGEPPAGWCRASVAVRAQPTLDHKWRRAVHDHTDDALLLPACAQHLLP